ncbi:MAG: hypothetical protein JWQ40_1530 [Segetibacter sp.]|nr:hypothetical protein [Segetibacter sp.]
MTQKSHQKINVLVVDGFSNHDWEQTSKLTKDILEETGLFNVKISTSPSTPNDTGWRSWNPQFGEYDVIIQNSNNIQNKTLRWPERVEKSLEEYVRSGGGLYILHSANNAFSHWKEYDKMIGLGWRPKETGYAIELDKKNKIMRIPPAQGSGTNHGKRFDAVVNIVAKHPIHKGFPKQWITPSMELYTYARGPAENLTVLSSAYDTATNKIWPVEWVVTYGKGRVYNSSMGHLWKGEQYPVSYRCLGFQTILIRATEWLATGKVAYSLPVKELNKNRVIVRSETDYPTTFKK